MRGKSVPGVGWAASAGALALARWEDRYLFRHPSNEEGR